MKAFALFVILLLVIPMTILNPMGRGAFAAYYAGVIATWRAYMFAFRAASTHAG
jgi:drug/metabolite transporter (DMT)-like permease